MGGRATTHYLLRKPRAAIRRTVFGTNPTRAPLVSSQPFESTEHGHRRSIWYFSRNDCPWRVARLHRRNGLGPTFSLDVDRAHTRHCGTDKSLFRNPERRSRTVRCVKRVRLQNSISPVHRPVPARRNIAEVYL
jgi:hypothetical protein